MIQLNVDTDVKMLRETLCVAQSRIATSVSPDGRWKEHSARLQLLINECDRLRPLGPDGKHGNLHNSTCGCEDVDNRPHSRACGHRWHPHGDACHSNCPTCGGK